MAIMPNKLFASQRLGYDQPLLLDDLKEALAQMANDKAPRLDGFPCEFFNFFWDMIGPDRLKVYQEVMHCGSLGKIIDKDVIKFIPKPSDLEIIRNWQPITLLNVSYKIIAKAFALKL